MPDFQNPWIWTTSGFPEAGAYAESLYPEMKSEGRFWIDLGRHFGRNALIARTGMWNSPWPSTVPAQFAMPTFDPSYSKSFSDVTDEQAYAVRKEINEKGNTFVLYYSGGIDSTLCLSALIKNLDANELKHVELCMSMDAVIENPFFFEKFIRGRFKIHDSARTRYSDIISLGHKVVTGDLGDAIFGTELGLNFYHRLAQPGCSEKPFTEFVDQLISYFKEDGNPQFGKMFYERVLQTTENLALPIRSLHDFFWWTIFNLKYSHSALRGLIFYYDGGNPKEAIEKSILNWFNSTDYQLWSMANNNNGQKIQTRPTETYKWAARKYIYDLDRNGWYFRHKLKLVSLDNIFRRSKFRIESMDYFGLDSEYRVYRNSDNQVRRYIKDSLERLDEEST
jgi:hypothetical protein